MHTHKRTLTQLAQYLLIYNTLYYDIDLFAESLIANCLVPSLSLLAIVACSMEKGDSNRKLQNAGRERLATTVMNGHEVSM